MWIIMIVIVCHLTTGFRTNYYTTQLLDSKRFSKSSRLPKLLLPKRPPRKFRLTHISNNVNLQLSNQHETARDIPAPSSIKDYITLIRPTTILQAVGAFIIGHLVILLHNQTPGRVLIQHQSRFILASISIYLSYGAGMAMNDVADAALDAEHEDKCARSIASGKISKRDGWIFCLVLSASSLIFAKLSDLSNSISVGMGMDFTKWNILNLILMASYALGMQRIFLIKNFICGYLAVSPLVGASLFSHDCLNHSTMSKLYQLAVIGFPLQVAREILKDIQDVEADKGKKMTLPLLIGEIKSKRIAYGLVSLVNISLLIFPHYWRMFSSKPPVYAISVAVGMTMFIRASMLPLVRGEKLLKKSIYVLLMGMIGGLLLQ